MKIRHTRHTLLALLAGSALAAATQLPAPATTDDPHFSDPIGDATLTSGLCPVDQCPLHVLSEDSIDIVSGDLQTVDGTLRISLTVVDLDDIGRDPTADRHYRVATGIVGATFDLLAKRSTAGTGTGTILVTDDYRKPPVTVDVPVSFDVVNNEVAWTVDLVTLNGLIAMKCTTCAPVADGTELLHTLADATLETYVDTSPVFRHAATGIVRDRAEANRGYVVGY